jgi:hypothetical protein
MIEQPASRGVSFLRGALRGYGALGRSFAGILLFAGITAAASALVAVPGWLLASRVPTLFSILALAAFGGGLAALLVLRVRREIRAAGGVKLWASGRLAPLGARIGFFAFSLCAFYGLILLFAAGLYAVAVPASVAYVLVVGWWAHRSRRRVRWGNPPPPADDRRDGKPA